jgi:phosphoglycolate phosphatase-like HAD superfamily hydrolase
MPVFLSRTEIERDGKALERDRGEIFKRRYLASVVAFADVRALFQRLQADGKQLALASSAKGEELERYKKIAGIADLIDEQTTSDDADSSKPEPDIFQAALKRLHVATPANAIVVGDTPYDAEGPAKAGLQTIGLRCGGWTDMELCRAGVIAVYRDPAELLAL